MEKWREAGEEGQGRKKGKKGSTLGVTSPHCGKGDR